MRDLRAGKTMKHAFSFHLGCLSHVALLAAALHCSAQTAETQYSVTKDRMHVEEREVIVMLLRMKINCNVTKDGRLLNLFTNKHHPVQPKTLQYIDGMPRLSALFLPNSTD